MGMNSGSASHSPSHLWPLWPAEHRHLTVAVLVLLCTANVWGSLLEFEDVDSLPQAENLLFSEHSVGIITNDRRYFVLGRHTQLLQQVSPQTFSQQFPEPWPPKPFEKHPSKEVFHSSAGQKFEQQPAYCGEGVQEAHSLRYLDRPFTDVLKPCTSVSALETVGNHLWLGTIQPSEGGPTPSEGVVVQSVDRKQKITTITTQAGLTGDQIRVLREDPFTKTVWVATEKGLNRINLQFRVIWAGYWHEDFAASSLKSQTLLSPNWKPSNPFAVLGRELAVQDWTAFAQAIEKISPAGRNKFKLYEFHMEGFASRTLPQDLNGLVPFFIEAIQSETPTIHNFGLGNICKFDDPRIQTFMATLASKTGVLSTDLKYVHDCLKVWPPQIP